MSQILLDNASRGSTTLLQQIVNSSGTVVGSTSDQLTAGTTLGDGTGEISFNAARKLKQWAADQNAMNALMLGNYLSVSVGANQNNWDPTGGVPGNLAAISRLDINPADPVNITGLIATSITDEKRIVVRNIGTANFTLQHQNAGSNSANQFYGPSEDFIVTPGVAIDIVYYLIASGPNYWVIKP